MRDESGKEIKGGIGGSKGFSVSGGGLSALGVQCECWGSLCIGGGLGGYIMVRGLCMLWGHRGWESSGVLPCDNFSWIKHQRITSLLVPIVYAYYVNVGSLWDVSEKQLDQMTNSTHSWVQKDHHSPRFYSLPVIFLSSDPV